MNCKHGIEADCCSTCLSALKKLVAPKVQPKLESLEDYINRKQDERIAASVLAIETKCGY